MKEKRTPTRSAEPFPPRAGPIVYTADDIAVAVLPWERKVRELEPELADAKKLIVSCHNAEIEWKARAEKAVKHLGSHGYPESPDDCSECKDLASIGQLYREREEWS